MRPASARVRRIVLVFTAAIFAFLLSPTVRLAAAEDGGLGAGGASFALNYTWILGLVLAFIFGFGLRDYFQKRALKAQAKARSVAKTAPQPAAKPATSAVAAPPRP